MQSSKKVYCIAQASISLNEIPDLQYSKVANLVPAVGIVIRARDRSQFTQSASVSFNQLIENKALKLGHVAEGFYSQSINKILEKHRAQAHVITRESSTSSEVLYRLLLKERLDYFLDFAFSYQFHLTGAKHSMLQFIPIEGQALAKKVYAFCNNTQYSKYIINVINQVIATKKYQQSQTQELVKYLPENLKSFFVQAISEQVGH